MIRIILLTIFLFITLNASDNYATKDDIKILIHQMDKRFEQVDKRFEQVDSRFEESHQLSMTIIYIIIALFGFIVWDRRGMMSATKKEMIKEFEPELVKKADKNILDKVIAIIEEMAKKDKEIEHMLTKHHLKLA